MPRLDVRTPEGVVLRAEIAGGGSRFAAALVDGSVFFLAYVSLALVALLVQGTFDDGFSDLVVGMLSIGFLLFLVLYHIVFGLLWDGRTPGKRLVGLRVATVEGYPASAWQHVLRNLIYPIDVFLPNLAPFGLLGLVSIQLSAQRQRLGDFAAGTLVLRDDDAARRREPFQGLTWSGLEERTLALAPVHAQRLTDEDRSLLADLWSRPVSEWDADSRRRTFVETARHYAERLELGEFEDARVFLRELYLFARERASS